MTDNQIPPSTDSAREPDDLDEMLGVVERDAAARAAYEDALWREALLTRLVQVRGSRRQRDVAAAMGTTQSAVSDLEKGHVDPRLTTLQRYARAIGAQVDLRIEELAESKSGAPGPVPYANTLALEQGLSGVLSDVYALEPTTGPQSTHSVARRTGLPESTVSFTMDQLLADGWLDLVSPNSGLERLYALRGQRGLVVGATLARDSILASLTDLRTSTLAETEHKLIHNSPEDVVSVLVEIVSELREVAGPDRDIVGLGVVLAGRVDGDSGLVLEALDLKGEDHRWLDVPLERLTEEATGFRAAVENDANALAMYAHLAAGDGRDTSVVVLTDQGVGAGLVFDGNITHGHHGLSGEIGHIIVEPDGVLCRCGSRGCLETLSSAQAIIRRVQETTGLSIGSLEYASLLVNEGNSHAEQVFLSAGEVLGEVLAKGMAIVGVPETVAYGPPELVDEADRASARIFLDGVRRAARRFPVLGTAMSVHAHVLTRALSTEAAAATALRYFLARPRRWVPDLAEPKGAESRPANVVDAGKGSGR